MVSNALVEIRPHDDGDHCSLVCPYGGDETCSLIMDAVHNGRTREYDPDAVGAHYWRTRVCLAAERRAKEVKP